MGHVGLKYAIPLLLVGMLLPLSAVPSPAPIRSEGSESFAAQISHPWSFDELRTKSDLVVIGEWMSTIDTGERGENEAFVTPLPVIVLNTKFKVLSILKGTEQNDKFLLRHYRVDRTRMPNGCVNCGLSLAFTATGPLGTYLLFLSRASDGTFVPTSGQAFPGDAIFALRQP